MVANQWHTIDTIEPGTLKPISNYIDGASVTINNGNVVLNLGTPKSEYLGKAAFMEGFLGDVITITPANSKLFVVYCFYTSDGKYSLGPWWHNDNAWGTYLIYAGENTTINGVAFKKGWSWLCFVYNDATDTYNVISSTTQHKDVVWYLSELD